MVSTKDNTVIQFFYLWSPLIDVLEIHSLKGKGERDDKRGVNVKKGNVTFFNLQVFSNLGKVKKKMLNPLIH